MQIHRSISTPISKVQHVRAANSLRAIAISVLVAGLALVASCSTPSEQLPTWLIITPMKTSYKNGDTVKVALDNGSNSSIGINLCGSTLQKQFGPNWTDVRISEIETACGESLWILRPNEHFENVYIDFANTNGALPASLGAGNYRIRIPSAVLIDTNEKLEGLNLVSAPFALTAP